MVTNRSQLTQLILDVRYGRKTLADETTTEGLAYAASTAQALILANQKTGSLDACLCGTIEDGLIVRGTIKGSLSISATIEGSLSIEDRGTIKGSLSISGTIEGGLHTHSTSKRELSTDVNHMVGGDVFVSGTINRLSINAGTINGDFALGGTIEGDLGIGGTIEGNFDVFDTIEGDLYIWGAIEGKLRIPGRIESDLRITGTIEGDLYVEGGTVEGRTDVLPEGHLTFGSLRNATFGRGAYLGEHVDLSRCDFRGFNDYEQLRFVGSTLFGDGGRKQIAHAVGEGPFPVDETMEEIYKLAHALDDIEPPNFEPIRVTPTKTPIPDNELAGIYRQLRQVYERQSNRPGASDFWYQELDARRRHAWKHRRWLEWAILSGYWVMSGYGQILWRSAVSFLIVATVSATLFMYNGFAIETISNLNGNKATGFKQATIAEAIVFTIKSMVSFFGGAPPADLGTGAQILQIILRFLGPTILTQAVLTVREKVAR